MSSHKPPSLALTHFTPCYLKCSELVMITPPLNSFPSPNPHTAKVCGPYVVTLLNWQGSQSRTDGHRKDTCYEELDDVLKI
jgi:hypothetical protein